MVRFKLMVILFLACTCCSCVSLTAVEREAIITKAAEVAAREAASFVKDRAMGAGLSEEAATEIAMKAANKAAELAARVADKAIPEEEKRKQKEQDKKTRGMIAMGVQLLLGMLGGGLKT